MAITKNIGGMTNLKSAPTCFATTKVGTTNCIDKLSADGNGGLQVDKENGQAYWIVQLDTVNKTITILL